MAHFTNREPSLLRTKTLHILNAAKRPPAPCTSSHLLFGIHLASLCPLPLVCYNPVPDSPLAANNTAKHKAVTLTSNHRKSQKMAIIAVRMRNRKQRNNATTSWWSLIGMEGKASRRPLHAGSWYTDSGWS